MSKLSDEKEESECNKNSNDEACDPVIEDDGEEEEEEGEEVLPFDNYNDDLEHQLGNFHFVVDDLIAGMCFKILTKEDLDYLRTRNIYGVVSLTEYRWRKMSQREELLNQEGFEYLQCGIVDYKIPSTKKVVVFLDFMDQLVGQGKGVIIHCAMGNSRTGMMQALYMIYKKRWGNLDDIVRKIRTQRKSVMVKSPCQLEFLRKKEHEWSCFRGESELVLFERMFFLLDDETGFRKKTVTEIRMRNWTVKVYSLFLSCWK